jgi:hypothetical protein
MSDPFIHFSTGGSIDANLSMTTDKTVIISRDMALLGDRPQLKEYREMLVAVGDNVAALKNQGRTRSSRQNPTPLMTRSGEAS